jgi:hypothetical protein
LKEIDLDIIQRYVNGLTVDSEDTIVESFFLHGEENESLIRLLEEDWNSINHDTSIPEVDLSHLLDRVHHIL